MESTPLLDDTEHLRPPPRKRALSSLAGSFAAPPYWLAHQRTFSNISYTSVSSARRPAQITLEDHTELPEDETSPLWAKAVIIDDPVVVKGVGTAAGAYVVWNCTVETLDGGPMKMRKRYSEFDKLRRDLIKTFPHSEAAMPPLPPKSVISKFRPRFLEKRRDGLSYFLKFVDPTPSADFDLGLP